VLNCRTENIISILKLVKIAFIILLFTFDQRVGFLDIFFTKVSGRGVVYAHETRIDYDVEGRIYVFNTGDAAAHYVAISCVSNTRIVGIEETIIEVYGPELKSGMKRGLLKWANLTLSRFCVYKHRKMGKRFKRSRLEICAQILRCLRFNLLSLTEIAFYAGLNYKAAKRYIELLMVNNLINAVKKDGKTYYMISPAGRQFLIHFEELKRLLRMENTSSKRI